MTPDIRREAEALYAVAHGITSDAAEWLNREDKEAKARIDRIVVCMKAQRVQEVEAMLSTFESYKEDNNLELMFCFDSWLAQRKKLYE